MENWKRNLIDFLNKEELILYFGWNRLLKKWISEWGDFMDVVQIGIIKIESTDLTINMILSNRIEQEISMFYTINYEGMGNKSDQVLNIEYTSNYNLAQNSYETTTEEISRKTNPIHENEFVLSYLNILYINYYTKYNHL
jgi:hypothetical protein